ncbi:hypothetical protein PQR37_38810 [Paraburkholderia nemoris]|uniref:hypothetical protein n=1 Tax=Paraburkholderia nemoris TaxID=2793076 RepID=UPI0038B807C8
MANIMLYHGTCVGWLMLPGKGFSLQDTPYGEADPPHKFIYLCTKWDGAESAAFTSKSSCERRIKNGTLSAADFVDNIPAGVPTPVVYTLDFQDPDEIDWCAASLDENVKKRVIDALESLCKEKNDTFTYIKHRAAFLLNSMTWQEWVDVASKKHCAELNSTDDKRVAVFKRGGFEFVRNLEIYPSNFGDTVAWILPVQPKQPTAVAHVVLATK